MKDRTRREFLRSTAGVAAGLWAAGTLPLAGCAAHKTVAQRSAAHNTAAPSGPARVAGEAGGEASLRAHGAARGLLYGCAVNVQALGEDPAYAQLVKEQAGILVAENEMKWDALRPAADRYNFDTADRFVAFAEENRMKIRGHNLCWHRSLPGWFAGTATTGNAQRLLTEHIEQVAGRYAGRMHSWDVVNEAVMVRDGRPDGLRVSPWLKLAGTDYIEIAFQAARRADPQALLTYNEYGIEDETYESEQKRAAVLLLLRRMKARNIPVDAVGVQSHIAARPMHGYGAGLTRFLRSVRELGLQVFLSEMDVNDRNVGADERARDASVAAAYAQYLDVALSDPAVTAVLTWGISDRYTWLNGEVGRADRRPERCLPFDHEDKPKEAFFALQEGFDRRGTAAPDRRKRGAAAAL